MNDPFGTPPPSDLPAPSVPSEPTGAFEPSESAEPVAAVDAVEAVEAVGEVDEVDEVDEAELSVPGATEADEAELSVPGATEADEPTLPTDEAAVLESLEADLAAVEEAVQTLDRISAEGISGSAAAEQITSVVSAARFPDGAPVTEVDLTGA